jgi:hypothetical protein
VQFASEICCCHCVVSFISHGFFPFSSEPCLASFFTCFPYFSKSNTTTPFTSHCYQCCSPTSIASDHTFNYGNQLEQWPPQSPLNGFLPTIPKSLHPHPFLKSAPPIQATTQCPTAQPFLGQLTSTLLIQTLRRFLPQHLPIRW